MLHVAVKNGKYLASLIDNKVITKTVTRNFK